LVLEVPFRLANELNKYTFHSINTRPQFINHTQSFIAMRIMQLESVVK